MLELNKIFLGDSLELMKEIEDGKIDLVVTDPPYRIGYADWDRGEFKEFTERWVKEIFRVLKPDGTLWSFMGVERIFDFVPILGRYGKVHLENWVVWARQKGRSSSKHFKSAREDIFHITK